MTIKERQNPDIITPQRKRRIAAGAGVDISEVNKMMKQFEQMRKMMKFFRMMGGKGKKASSRCLSKGDIFRRPCVIYR